MSTDSPMMENRDFKPEEASLMRASLLSFSMRLLRPVIRVLLRYGLTYPEMNQICRWLCVDITMTEKEFFVPRRRRQFKARVACMTALSRKEVLRLYSSPRPDRNNELVSSNRAFRVLEGWLSDNNYLDASQAPLIIPFRARDGHRSFSALVGIHSGDIPPRAILDELIRAGCCEMVGEDEVRVRNAVYITRPVDSERMEEAGLIAARALSQIDHLLGVNTEAPDNVRTRVREDAQIETPQLHAV